MYQVGGKEFNDWTLAQDQCVIVGDDGIEYVIYYSGMKNLRVTSKN